MRLDVLNAIKNIKEDKNIVNISELARRFNCDRRTVSKYLNQDVVEKRKPKKKTTKLDEYKDLIVDKVDNYQSKSMAVFKLIKDKGYKGSYHTVNNFVRKHKNNEVKKATIRFETSKALQAQVDWKENVKMVSKHGEIFEFNLFLMVLGYSRTKYIELTVDRKQTTLFECITNAFQYFGGIPKEILFDNMKTVVDRSRSTFSKVTINKKFQHFANDAGFEVKTCLAYRPQTKGKVESLAKLVERLKVYNEEFETYEDLVNIIKNFNKSINQEISQATKKTPNELLEKEKEYFNPLISLDILKSYFHHEKTYKVSKESMITFKGKKYSVPIRYIGKLVTVLEKNSNLQIYYTKELIVCHNISENMYSYKKDHFREILKSDSLRHLNNEEIDSFIKDKLSHMDIFLEE